ncbi:MAG: ABC transporter ATP-binding protein [Chitinophagales bacterium]
MLKVLDLTKSFNGTKAVENLQFQISHGEFFSLLGPNGAGKTTTINIISTLLKPDAGSIYLDGKDVYVDVHASKMQMGIVPQEIALYEELSAWANLDFWGRLYGLRGVHLHKRIQYLLEWVGLSERKNDLIRTYSGGMKRRINIAAALIHSPDLIIMD